MRISDWSSDVCSSDLRIAARSAVATLRHHYHRRSPRAQPEHRFSVGLPAATVAQAPRPEIDHYFGNHRCRPFRAALCPQGPAGAGHRSVGQAESGRYRSEEHTSELQSLMRISYAVFCLKKKTYQTKRSVTMLNTHK